ncbi:MAG: nucleoside hydrolase [Deltaproteobacteria bacterium]|nr:nucleoside hydrolase [Deltaproteobacteria bacterium]
MTSAEVRPIHLDTDPGLDDLLAIALALALPELRVDALTTVAGNACIDRVTENAQRFAALAGLALPIGRGAAEPLALSRCDAAHFHGEDGRRGVSIPALDRRPVETAASVLRARLAAHGVRCVVALGPLTNLATLAREQPTLLEGIEIVWMGGALQGGNVTPVAEFNAYADPQALSTLLDSAAALRVIPLEVTETVALREADVGEQPFGASELGRTLEAVLRALMEAERPTAGEARASLHDPCAVLAATRRDLFRYEEKVIRIQVDESSDRGRLSELPAGSGRTVHYAVEARADEIKRIFLDGLRRLGEAA